MENKLPASVQARITVAAEKYIDQSHCHVGEMEYEAYIAGATAEYLTAQQKDKMAQGQYFKAYLIVYSVDHNPYSENIAVFSDNNIDYDQVKSMYPEAKELFELTSGRKIVSISSATPNTDYQQLKAEYIELGKRFNTAQATLNDQAIQYQQLKSQYENLQTVYTGLFDTAQESAAKYQQLKDKADKMEAALKNIAMQNTCEETENDPDGIVGSDGKKMGDIEVGYDCCIEEAREALSAWKEGKKEVKP